MRKPLKRWLIAALKILITVTAFYLISRKLDWEETLKLLSSLHIGWVLMAMLAFLLSKWLGAMRLQVLWRASKVNVSNGYNNRLYLLSMFYNLLLPGGIGGDGYKVFLMNKRFGIKVRILTSAVFLDRANGLSLLIILGLALSAFIPLPYDLHTWLWLTIPLLPLGYYFAVWLIFRRFTGTFLPTSLWSAGVQIGQAIVALFILLALGVQDHVLEYIFILILSGIVLVVPLPSFGGFGLREWVVLFGAEFLGLDSSVSVAMSLTMYLVILTISMCGVYFHFRSNSLTSPDNGTLPTQTT